MIFNAGKSKATQIPHAHYGFVMLMKISRFLLIPDMGTGGTAVYIRFQPTDVLNGNIKLHSESLTAKKFKIWKAAIHE